MLTANPFEAELSRSVRPKKSFECNPKLHWMAAAAAETRDLERISNTVARMEVDEEGIPILLKQYLKLGGCLRGFNVDPDFENALDGLIMVDPCLTGSESLDKSMGQEGARSFLYYHGQYHRAWKKVS